MIRTVSLWIRSNGKFSKPSYQDNKQTRLKPQDGEYYLRCAGKWEAVGSDPLLALDAKARKEKLLRDTERGVVPVTEAQPHLRSPGEETRLTVAAAIDDYMTTGKAAQKDWRKHTRQCYTLALKLFTESCKKTYMDEIDGDDLKSFTVNLRSLKTSIGKNVNRRTVYNHFLNTVSFLNTYGRRKLIPQSEWPTFEEKKVVAYDPEVMQHLLQFADVDGLSVVPSLAEGSTQTFTGKVSDAMCGAKHSEAGIAPADCVRTCVQKGANYALVVGDKVYTLKTSDKATLDELAKLAWEQAKISGTASGDIISVKSAAAAK